MPLIMHSKSTEDYARKLGDDLFMVKESPSEKSLRFYTDDEIIAVGGGSVIDTAKIAALASRSRKVTAIPTTASGAGETSHAVYWQNGRKYSVKTPKPEIKMNLKPLETLPKDVMRATSYDALGHALESLWSTKATVASRIFAQKAIKIVANQIINDYPSSAELIGGGNLAGRAIETAGTNIAHAISYPLTGFYGIPHGLAVGLVLPAVAEYVECNVEIPRYKINMKKDFNFPLIADETMKYNQIHDAIKNITRKGVLDILRKSL